jgi:hypothetical protein
MDFWYDCKFLDKVMCTFVVTQFSNQWNKNNLSVFAFEKTFSNVTMFQKNFETKPTLIGIILGWVISQNIQYT